MKYAVAVVSGKQLRLEEGKTYTADRFDGSITDVVLFVDGDQVEIGQPLVEGVKIKLSNVEHLAGPKVEIRRYEAKSRRRKKKGHRQPITRFTIEKIDRGTKSSSSK